MKIFQIEIKVATKIAPLMWKKKLHKICMHYQSILSVNKVDFFQNPIKIHAHAIFNIYSVYIIEQARLTLSFIP